MTAAQIIELLLEVAPEVLADVDAWIHSAGSEKLAIAAARKAGEAAVDAYEAAKDEPKP